MSSFKVFRAVLGYAIIYFVMIKQIATLEKLKGVFIVLIVSHIVIAMLSPEIVLEPETRSYLNQAAPFLGDGNDFALSVSITLPLCLFLYLEAKKKFFKLFSLISFVLLTLCIVGTSSRGGFLALTGVTLYFFFKSPKKAKAFIGLLLLVFVIYLFAPPSFYLRIKTIKNYESESSASARIMVWKQAIKMAQAHPILGVGAGHFPIKFGTEFRPPGYPERGGLAWLTAHSIYFLSLGELGFPGLIVLVYIIISNLLSNEKRIRSLKQINSDISTTYQRLFICLNAALIGFAIGGGFLSALYYPHLYIIAGLITSGEFIFNREVLISTDDVKYLKYKS
jgi:probable O-glycosylation ligase (exosortase A-associated)